MPARLWPALSACLLCLLLAACPAGKTASPAAIQAALAPRVVQLPGGWPIGDFKPPASLQQVKLTPQLLAAIEARAGTAPPVSSDGYEIDGQPYKEMQEDSALAGISGQATSTDAPDATDRARPGRKGQYWLIACTGAADWEQLATDTQQALQSDGFRRIEGNDGPEGAVARYLNGDESALAVLIHRQPRDDHREYGVLDEYIWMACTLEKRKPRPDEPE